MTTQRRAPKKPNGPEAFAAALNDVMTARGITKAELAERIGRSPSAIGNYTLGRDVPSPETVFAMEETLGLAAGHLSRLLGYCPCDPVDGITFEQAVLADPKLPSEQKHFLLGIYRGLVRPVS